MSTEFGSAAPPTRATASRSSWLLATAALLPALAALTVLYRTTAASIVTTWSKDPFAHGYTVVPLALYLVWHRRADLKALVPSTGYLALPAIGLLTCLWLLGYSADTGLVQQISLVGLIGGFVWLILGWPAARVLMYPLGCLFFALPLGDKLVPVLQDLAARGAVRLLALSGVPVLLQAHVISIPDSSWRVAEACSGINYLTASLAVGYVYAGTNYRYWLHRIGFLFGAALVPIIGNTLRVYGTIFLAAKAGPDSVAGTRHFLFGWLVFASMMALLFVVCGRWREESQEAHAPGIPKREPRFVGLRAICTALGLLIAAVAPISTRADGGTIEGVTPSAPAVSLPWTPTETNRYAWKPHFEKSGQEFVQSYESGSSTVKMFTAFYAGDHTRSNLAGVDNALVHESSWITTHDRRKVRLQGQSVTVRETVVDGLSTPLLVWNWYWVNGAFADSEYSARLSLAKAGLLRRPRESFVVAIATENRPSLQPQTVLQDFLLHFSLPPVVTPRRLVVAHTDNAHSD